MYRVYQDVLIVLIRSFISSFVFLPSFEILQSFVTLFSGTVRPTKLKIDTHVNNGWMHRVYRNQTAVAYSSLPFFFLFLHFPNIKNFRHTFLKTSRPTKLKRDTHMNNGYIVYTGTRLLLLSVPFFFFLCFIPILKHVIYLSFSSDRAVAVL